MQHHRRPQAALPRWPNAEVKISLTRICGLKSETSLRTAGMQASAQARNGDKPFSPAARHSEAKLPKLASAGTTFMGMPAKPTSAAIEESPKHNTVSPAS